MSPVIEVFVVVAANVGVAWLANYLIHSTLFFGLAVAAERTLSLSSRDRALGWRLALLAPPVTALAQAALGRAWTPWASEASAISPILGVYSTMSAMVLVVLSTIPVVAVAIIAASNLRLIRVLARKRSVDRSHAALLETVSQRLRFREVTLTTSAALTAPAAVGASEICLPERVFGELAPDEQKALLAHEVAHLVRRDSLWIAAATAITRVFPFQPLNRLSLRRLRHASEEAADDFAADVTGDGPALARALGVLAWALVMVPVGTSGAGAPLVIRVERLLERGNAVSPPSSRLWRGMFVAAALALMIVPAGLVVSPRRAANFIPWLAPSKLPPNERMLEFRCFRRGLVGEDEQLTTTDCSRQSRGPAVRK